MAVIRPVHARWARVFAQARRCAANRGENSVRRGGWGVGSPRVCSCRCSSAVARAPIGRLAYDDLKKNGWKVPANRDKAAYMLNQNEQDECQCLGPCEAGSEYCGHAIFYEDVPPKEDKKGSSKNAKSEL